MTKRHRYSIFKIYFMAQTLPVYRMLNQPVSPKAKVVGRLSPRITRELKRVSSLRLKHKNRNGNGNGNGIAIE